VDGIGSELDASFVAFFSKVMAKAHAYDNPDAEPRDASADPGRSSWDRREAELDVVDMLIQRRQFHADRVSDAIASIHLFSDASPVTGEELQGMLVDIVRKDGTTSRSTLPGASLCYGAFSAVAKCLALVWVVFLIAGPAEEDMRYFFKGWQYRYRWRHRDTYHRDPQSTTSVSDVGWRC